jgi:hypothetical protein
MLHTNNDHRNHGSSSISYRIAVVTKLLISVTAVRTLFSCLCRQPLHTLTPYAFRTPLVVTSFLFHSNVNSVLKLSMESLDGQHAMKPAEQQQATKSQFSTCMLFENTYNYTLQSQPSSFAATQSYAWSESRS